jgi:Fe2+ or Zn2+ uptake regulation protein
MNEDDERSAKAICNLLASRHINIALITVRRQLKKLAWTYGKAW